MTSELLLSLATAAMPAFCSATVTTASSFDDAALARYNYNTHHIVMSQELFVREVEHAVLHEAGHCVENQHDIRIPAFFGRAPFVTEYAETDKFEDFAESMAFEMQGKRIGGRKGRFVRRLLRQLR